MLLIWIAKIIAVIVLLSLAAALATPAGRLPLALRGMLRVLKPEAGAAAEGRAHGTPPSLGKRLAAFALVLAAAALVLL